MCRRRFVRIQSLGPLGQADSPTETPATGFQVRCSPEPVRKPVRQENEEPEKDGFPLPRLRSADFQLNEDLHGSPGIPRSAETGSPRRIHRK